nr:AAA family ATPase [Microvirga antarctica]
MIADAVAQARPIDLGSGRPRPGWPVIFPSSLQDVPIPPRLWCVPDWIPDKVVTLLSGDGGTGKSLLGMQLATCAAMGIPFLGMELAQRKVLYFSAEDDGDELHRRQADINRGLGIDMGDLEDRLVWRVLNGDDALLAVPDERSKRLVATPTYSNLSDYCRENGIQLVIIDTVADTFGGLEIDRQQVTRYVRLIEACARTTGGAAVLLAHPSVSGMKEGTGISGNTAWRNSVRSVIYMRRPTEEEASGPDARDMRILERLKGNFAPSNSLLTLRYFEGHFLVDQPDPGGGPGWDPITNEVKVMRAIREAIKRGKLLSPARNSSDYAPKVLMPFAEVRGMSRLAVERAIGVMTGRGELREAHIGPSNNRRRVIVPSDHSPLPGETDPMTGTKKEPKP